MREIQTTAGWQKCKLARRWQQKDGVHEDWVHKCQSQDESGKATTSRTFNDPHFPPTVWRWVTADTNECYGQLTFRNGLKKMITARKKKENRPRNTKLSAVKSSWHQMDVCERTCTFTCVFTVFARKQQRRWTYRRWSLWRMNYAELLDSQDVQLYVWFLCEHFKNNINVNLLLNKLADM